MVIFLGLGSGFSGWSYLWGEFWMQWMVIFMGGGLDAVDGHISRVRSGCSGWSYFCG